MLIFFCFFICNFQILCLISITLKFCEVFFGIKEGEHFPAAYVCYAFCVVTYEMIDGFGGGGGGCGDSYDVLRVRLVSFDKTLTSRCFFLIMITCDKK